MNWAIIALAILAIIGSMMWMMPSPRQRAQAIFRQQAMRAGLQVQMTKLLFPRAIGEHAPEEFHCIAYRQGRNGHKIDKHYRPWHIFRLNAHANRGLPDGWCWGKGEDQLPEVQLARINTLVEAMPADVYSIESTPVAVSVYWNENGTPETVELIVRELKALAEERI